MMKFLANELSIDKNVAIHFRHKPAERKTECAMVTVVDGKEGEEIALATALVHPFDNYDHEKGRKVSLTALLNLVWPHRDEKYIRERVWSRYWATKKQKKN